MAVEAEGEVAGTVAEAEQRDKARLGRARAKLGRRGDTVLRDTFRLDRLRRPPWPEPGNAEDWLAEEVSAPPLHDACFWGDLAEVKRLLSQPGKSGYGADKNEGAGDMTPLHWACLQGQTDVVRELRCHFVAKGGLSAWKTAVETRNGGGLPLELAENKETVREGDADSLNGRGAQLTKSCHLGNVKFFRAVLDAARKIEDEGERTEGMP